MKRTTDLPELLAPAGSLEAFYAAIHAGADAVYMGTTGFNARAFAGSPDLSGFAEAVTYAHLRKKRVYVTLNTLLCDKEIPAFLSVAEALYDLGTDAAIVADLGGISLLQRHLPHWELHGSTQMSVHSARGAVALVPFGITRVVPARELSLSDICTLTEQSPLEVEVFLHGALCVSHSGQCLFSSLVGGRSGNRGECAQPCRLPYNGGYPLSLRDLSLAGHIPELVQSGVSSLKIEGRMKSPAYVAGCVSIYRKLLDEKRNATKEEEEALRSLFSRSGFTDGYFTGGKTQPMTGIRREEDKAESRRLPEADTKPVPVPVPVTGCAVLRAGEAASLTLTLGERSVTVTGTVPEPAKTVSLTLPEVKSRLSKMGGTPIALTEEGLTVFLAEGLFLSPGELNRLRRAAVEKLLSPFRSPVIREVFASTFAEEIGCPIPENRKPLVFCYDPRQITGIPDRQKYMTFVPLFRLSESRETPDGILLPPVIFDREEPEVRAMLSAARERGIRYGIADNIAGISLLQEAGLVPIGGFRLNVCNQESRKAYQCIGISDVVLSPELTPPQCRDIGGYAIAYGRIPLMLLERCFMKENFGCEACSHCSFTDRRGISFPLLREYPHRNLLLNSLPTYMGDRPGEWPKGVLPCFFFTMETPVEVRQILGAYVAKAPLPFPVRRMGRMASDSKSQLREKEKCKEKFAKIDKNSAICLRHGKKDNQPGKRMGPNRSKKKTKIK